MNVPGGNFNILRSIQETLDFVRTRKSIEVICDYLSHAHIHQLSIHE